MSFKINQNQQITLIDSFIQQIPRTQKIIMNSWCKDFADLIFPSIKEERFSVLYSNFIFSRPKTPVNFIVGAFLLKENNNLNDDQWHEFSEYQLLVCVINRTNKCKGKTRNNPLKPSESLWS